MGKNWVKKSCVSAFLRMMGNSCGVRYICSYGHLCEFYITERSCRIFSAGLVYL